MTKPVSSIKMRSNLASSQVAFTPQNLSIEFDRPADNLVSVTFAMAASDFEEASRVVTISSGEIELP